MGREDYLDDLGEKLAAIERHLNEARQKLSAGAIADRMEAVRSLTGLETQRASLVERMETAKERGAEAWTLFHTEVREEVDTLLDDLQSWIVRH